MIRAEAALRTALMHDLRRVGDRELMERVRDGDSASFALVYDRHIAAVRSLARRMLSSDAAAQEVSQETFLDVWRSAGTFDAKRAPLRSWILALAHHRAYDVLKRGSRGGLCFSSNFADLRVFDDDLAQLAVRHEQTAAVRSALRTLPPEQARVIELSYYLRFTQVEIAAMVGVPLGTVKGRLRLGLKKLGEMLTEDAADAPTSHVRGRSRPGQ